MSEKFILLSYGRSGTGFINSTVGKYFNLHHTCEIELLGSCRAKMEKIQNPIKTIKNYYHTIKLKNPNDIIYGFKWKPGYMYPNYNDLFLYLKNANIKIIVNYRNPIDKIISNIKLKEIGTSAHYKKHHNRKIVKKIRQDKIYIPTKDLIENLKQLINNMKEYIKLLKQYEISYLEVNYEDLSDKNIEKWSTLLNFLVKDKVNINKLNYILDNPKYIKVMKKSHYEIISNYNEVSEVLKDTPYDQYLTKIIK